jgi:hypothetical protein
MSDHYIVAKHNRDFRINNNETISLFIRGHGDILDIINVPRYNIIYEVKGKWALLNKPPRPWRRRHEYVFGIYSYIMKSHVTCY